MQFEKHCFNKIWIWVRYQGVGASGDGERNRARPLLPPKKQQCVREYVHRLQLCKMQIRTLKNAKSEFRVI